jgi:hypothetical protein
MSAMPKEELGANPFLNEGGAIALEKNKRS